MKKILILVFGLMFSLLIFAVTEVTIHVDDAYRPMSYSENGVAKGMYIDVLKAISKNMEDFTIKLEPIPWQRGKAIMKAGIGFGLTPAFFHGHDWPYLYPYSLAIYTETIVAICTKKTAEKVKGAWPNGYIGMSVGNIAGFDGWGGEKFHKLVKDGKIKYDESQDSKGLIFKLISGRIDCIMMEKSAFAFELNKLKAAGTYKGKPEIVQSAIIGEDPVYIGYSNKNSSGDPYREEFKKEFDIALYKLIKSGERDKIMEAYTE